jgi:hypothetical protein
MFMSNGTKNALRMRVDELLDQLIVTFYKDVPYAQHQLNSRAINMDYYIRHNIETILRIRKKRTVDALAIRYFTKHDPVRAKAWAEYTAEEMLHDSMFARDLASVGVSTQSIYAHEPLYSTKLLMGYLLYGLEYEGTPLALVTSVYFVEYTTTKTQPQWLDNLEKALGKDKITGARAHVNTDLDDNHADFVWDVLASLVRSPEDEEMVIKHIKDVYSLYESYFVELYRLTVGCEPVDHATADERSKLAPMTV